MFVVASRVRLAMSTRQLPASLPHWCRTNIQENRPNWWLMKTEPSEFSIQDLRRRRSTVWDGVRNFQARNFLRCMRVGDLILVYHSNVPVPAIVGTGVVSSDPFADPSQFDKESKYYDNASNKEDPRWTTVRVSFGVELPTAVSLDALREMWTVDDSVVVRAGNRLSVVPVQAAAAEKALGAAALREATACAVPQRTGSRRRQREE